MFPGPMERSAFLGQAQFLTKVAINEDLDRSPSYHLCVALFGLNHQVHLSTPVEQFSGHRPAISRGLTAEHPPMEVAWSLEGGLQGGGLQF